MKKFILLPLLLLCFCFVTLTNCQERDDLLPVYENFKTDLEAKNLFGHVKSVELSKQDFYDDSPTLKEIETFNNRGNFETYEQFDTDGTKEDIKEWFYDSNGHLIKSIEKDLMFDQTRTTLFIKDTINTTESRQIFNNDVLQYEYSKTYNASGLITTEEEIKDGNTTALSYDYKLNDTNKIIQIERTYNNETKLFKEYKYDSDGNKIEALIHDTYLIYKTTSDYKGKRLLKVTESRITKQPEEFIESVVTYDNYFNPIHKKLYRENKLITEYTMTYEFDENHNWIKKTVETKDYIFDEEEGFQPDYIETRKINYWK